MGFPSRWADSSWDDESGIGLIETLIAIVILSVAIIALVGTSVFTIQDLGDSRDRQEAVQIASSVLEGARAVPFGDIALDPAEPGVSALTTFNGETIVAATGGQIAYQSTVETFEVTTFVTAVGDTKRLTTQVSWPVSAPDETVTNSTIIADADRGLPAPAFTISPSVTESTSIGAANVGCVEFTMTNNGAQDSYDFILSRARTTPVGGGALSDMVVAPLFSIRTVDADADGAVDDQRQGFVAHESGNSGPAGNEWFVYTEFVFDSAGTDVQPFVESTGDVRPDAPRQLATNEAAGLRVCFDGGDDVADRGFSFDLEYRSIFDPAVTNEVTVNLGVGSVAPPGTSGSTLEYFPKAGLCDSANNANQQCLLQITDAAPTVVSLPDYDDAGRAPVPHDGLPGLYLSETSTNNAIVRFRSAIAVPVAPAVDVTLDTIGTFTFFSAHTGTIDNSGAFGPQTLSYDVELVKVTPTNGSNEARTTLATTSAVVTHSDAGWDEVTVTLDMSATTVTDRTFDTTESLELVVRCRTNGSNAVPCHIAFDTTAYPAVLQLDVA